MAVLGRAFAQYQARPEPSFLAVVGGNVLVQEFGTDVGVRCKCWIRSPVHGIEDHPFHIVVLEVADNTLLYRRLCSHSRFELESADADGMAGQEVNTKVI